MQRETLSVKCSSVMSETQRSKSSNCSLLSAGSERVARRANVPPLSRVAHCRLSIAVSVDLQRRLPIAYKRTNADRRRPPVYARVDRPLVEAGRLVRVPEVVEVRAAARHAHLNVAEPLDARLVHVDRVNAACLSAACPQIVQNARAARRFLTCVHNDARLHSPHVAVLLPLSLLKHAACRRSSFALTAAAAAHSKKVEIEGSKCRAVDAIRRRNELNVAMLEYKRAGLRMFEKQRLQCSKLETHSTKSRTPLTSRMSMLAVGCARSGSGGISISSLKYRDFDASSSC